VRERERERKREGWIELIRSKKGEIVLSASSVFVVDE